MKRLDVPDNQMSRLRFWLGSVIYSLKGYRHGEVYFVSKPSCEIDIGFGSNANGRFPIKIDAEKGQKFKIGKYTSIGYSLNIIMAGGHKTGNMSTFPFKGRRYTQGNVEIGNDVWIGNDVTILGNVKIGDGAVIGAKALVTSNQTLEPYGVYAGIPAKLIKYRFDKKTRDRLMKLKWWDLPENVLAENSDAFYMPLEEAISHFEKLRKG